MSDEFTRKTERRLAEARERVRNAIEGLPSARQDEVMAWHAQMEHPQVSNYYDPACLTLRYSEWRRDNDDPSPNHPDSRPVMFWTKHRDTLGAWRGACVDRERIVEANAHRAVGHILQGGSGNRHGEDQRQRIAACVGETVADSYVRGVKDPSTAKSPWPRGTGTGFSSAFTECRRQHGG